MTQSATGQRWELPDDATDRCARLIAQRHGLPHLLACVLAMRGVEVEEVLRYLDPDLREPDPGPLLHEGHGTGGRTLQACNPP